MIEKIIEYSARNRVIVLMLFALIVGWGVWAVYQTPVDAIPDLSDNQVIVFTDYPGRSPQVVEDQVTYPLAVNLQGLPQGARGAGLVRLRLLDDLRDLRGQGGHLLGQDPGPGAAQLRRLAAASRGGADARTRRHRGRPCLLVHHRGEGVRPGAAPHPAGLVRPLPAEHRARRGRGGLHRRLRSRVPDRPGPATGSSPTT